MDSINLKSKKDLLNYLRSQDITLPVPTQGKTKEQCEKEGVCRLLATLRNINILHNDKFSRQTVREHGSMLETDQKGRFTFPAKDVVHPLMISHEAGFAVIEKPITKNPLTIRLQAWTSVSGCIQYFNLEENLFASLSPQRPRLASDPPKKPANRFVSTVVNTFTIDDRSQPPLLPQMNHIPPDENGDFQIDHVPPGHWWVTVSKKEIHQKLPRETFTFEPTDAVEVDIKPGEVVEVNLEVPIQ